MMLSRRHLVAGSGAVLFVGPQPATADDPGSANGLLARLRQQGSVRVGIANAPPFSSMLPDGTMSGVGPALAKRILERLGIPKMEGAIATYGELIPGMLAGRWDFVAASMTITKERCAQVLYADPITFEGPCIVAPIDKNPSGPKTIADLAKLRVTVGALSGGAQFRQLLAGGVAPELISQFPTEVIMVDALLAGRIAYLYVTHIPIVEISKRRQIKLDVVFPVGDASAPGASNVFRMQDTDLHSAYQRELRAMKASGEYLPIARNFGFEIPDGLMNSTSDQQCRLASSGT